MDRCQVVEKKKRGGEHTHDVNTQHNKPGEHRMAKN